MMIVVCTHQESGRVIPILCHRPVYFNDEEVKRIESARWIVQIYPRCEITELYFTVDKKDLIQKIAGNGDDIIVAEDGVSFTTDHINSLPFERMLEIQIGLTRRNLCLVKSYDSAKILTHYRVERFLERSSD